jgi:putative membrane protein
MIRMMMAIIGLLTATSAFAQECPSLSIAGFEMKDGKQWTVNINLDAEEYTASIGTNRRTATIDVTCTGSDIQIVQTGSSDGDDCNYALTRQGAARVGATVTGQVTCSRGLAQLTNAKLTSPGPVTMNDGRVLHAIQTADTMAIRFCAIVVGLAQRAEVRSFAQTLMEDHTDLNKRIEQVAQETGLKLKKNPVSAALEAMGEQKRQELVRTPGQAVDRKFVDSEITFHRRMVTTFNQKLIPFAQAPKVKAFLNSARETFTRHEQHAANTAPVLGIPAASLNAAAPSF